MIRHIRLGRTIAAAATTTGLVAAGIAAITVTAPSASAASATSFCSTTPIAIYSASTAAPYPSTIDVSGLSGTIGSVTVTLKGLDHPYSYDLTTQVTGPGGQQSALTDHDGIDNKSTANGANRVVGDYTFDDSSTSTFPGPAGTYKPKSPLSTFADSDPNGTWGLYVSDLDNVYSNGTMAGWCLTVNTLLPSAVSATVSPTSSSLGDAVTVDPDITPAAATGDLTYSIDGGAYQPVPGAFGAPFTLPNQAVGPHTVEVRYADPSGTYARSTTGLLGFSVAKRATTTTATVSPSSSAAGDTVTVDPDVAGSPRPTTGTIAYSIDGGAYQDVTGTFGDPFTLPSQPAGSHTVEVRYNDPSGTYEASTSGPLSFSVATRPSRVTLTTDPSSAVSGQSVTPVVKLAQGGPGTIQYTLDAEPLGAPRRTDSPAPTLNLPAGTYRLGAEYVSSDPNVASAKATTTLRVAKAATTTALTVGTDTLTADVDVVDPGSGVPSGDVTFTVDGDEVGTAALDDGTAVLDEAVDATSDVVATYSGDAAYTGSSSSRTVSTPSITATISSAKPRTGFGWYRTPVRVTFTCTGDDGVAIETCTAPVRITSEGARQVVVGTATAADGGTASVTRRISLDRTAPSVRAGGVKDGATYDSRPAVRCIGDDALSGLARCKTVTTKVRRGVFRYRVVAVDKAGNVSRDGGVYRIG